LEQNLLTVLFLFCIALTLFLKNLSKTGSLPLLLFALPVLFLTSFAFEYATISFLNSDEIFYKASADAGFSAWDEGRGLWIATNYLIINDLICGSDVFLKLVNIPLFVVLIYTIWVLFDRNKYVFWMPLFLPYFCYLAQTNLRDIAILLLISLFFLALKCGGKGLYFCLICLLLLVFTRQFMIPIVLLAAGVSFVCSPSNRTQAFQFKAKHLVIVFIAIILTAYFSDKISSRLDAHAKWFEYTTGEGRSGFSEQQSKFQPSGSLGLDFVRGSTLYIFGPRPHSILIRAIEEGGTPMWGLTDDLVRFWNQVGYYLLMLYIALNAKGAIKVIKSFLASQLGFAIVLFSYMPIYSFHLYGTTHQRLKIPFQVLLFIISVSIFSNKKEKLL
jgi:hypothetical protein